MADRQADPESAAWVLATTTAISRGDRGALAEFYEAWFDRCYAMARSLTGRDESFCLDVVQETMLRVIKALKPLGCSAELAAWMMRATRSAALDLFRKESRRLRRESRRGGMQPGAPEIDDRIEWLREGLLKLPSEDGSLVALRVAGERSLDAVGAAAGISGDAAHGRVRRALDRLRRWAKETDHEH